MWKGNSVVFRGYFHGKADKSGKTSPAEKVKDKPGHSWTEVCKDDSFGAVLNDGFVDISFDSEELSTAFWDMAEKNNWNCLILENPVNGHIHSYWKKPEGVFSKDGRDKKLAVGLIADIHSKDTYIRLKDNGVERFPPSFEPNDIQVAPEELYPVETSVDLWGMETGDGRNDELFKYILILQSNLALSNEVIRRILGNTNQFVFSEPLSDEELEVILRDDAFKKPVFYKGKTFLFDKFANYMQNVHHVVKINGQLHTYTNGAYVSGYKEIEKQMISYIPNLKKTQRREVLDLLELTANELQPSDPNYISFANGILDRVNQTLLPFSPDYVITNHIAWNYDPNAYCEITDHTLNKIACGDPEIRALLEECIGYCFYRSNRYRKAFILTGEKRNGKSTFLDCIKAILGDDNICSLELNELSERFNTGMLAGKLADIGDDISDEFMRGREVSVFKKLVSGNRIKAERKGYDPFEFDPYAKLLFSANDIPRMKDKTGAVLDRLIIIPFNAVFLETDPDYDPNIEDKVLQRESIEYLIRLGVEGLGRIIDLAKGFTKSSTVEKQIEQYGEENNPFEIFAKSVELDEILNQSTPDVFKMYQVFCAENNLQSMGNVVFTKQICKRFKLKSVQRRINGKRTYVYEKG